MAKSTGKFLKCVGELLFNTQGSLYEVFVTENGSYYILDGDNDERFEIINRDFALDDFYSDNFEIVKTPKVEHTFSVGDKVVINKISDDFVSSNDKNVKVGDVATVTMIESYGGYDVRLTNPNWRNAWWFSRNDLSLADNSMNYNLLSHQEVIQAVIDGKELEIQYTDGTWDSMSPINTTLHQLTTLNFRLKTSLEDKRKAVIKKLLTTKVAVLCKCWDDDDIGEAIVAITRIDDDYTYPYMNNCLAYKNAYAIDDNGNEITNL